MFKGFYNLTSSMLTHQQNLNVIANNMVNISTAGYKQDRYTASTFDDVMYSRMGNKPGRRLEDRAISAPPAKFTPIIHRERWNRRE
jgi:flagellar basal body rod protein FlgG